jgi:Na+-driven multidrug efflux pump
MVLKKHDLLRLPSVAALRETLPTFMAIGLPAVLTQIATPVGNAFVTHAIAPFGDGAVAGWAVVVRLIPVAFVVLFALSGAIGPIVGQNLGAGRFDRLRQTLRQSLALVLGYVAIVWLLLALGANLIADAFGAQGEAREVIVFFCRFVAGSFAFNGALFVANAAFNNLGFAFYSTALNWGRATLGVAPFVWVGATLGGTQGIMAGYGLGVVGFGAIGIWLCFKTVDRLGPPAA